MHERKTVTYAPKKFHVVWVGNPMPEKYLRHLHELAIVLKQSGFELNLWVDDEKNYYNGRKSAAASASDYKQFPELANINLRNVNELKNRMIGKNADRFYKNDRKFIDNKKNSNKGKLLWEFIEREMVGERNLAACADLLRLEILRQEGGYYVDADNYFLEIHSPDLPIEPEALDHTIVYENEEEKLIAQQVYEERMSKYVIDKKDYNKTAKKFYSKEHKIPVLTPEPLPLGIKGNFNISGEPTVEGYNIRGVSGNNDFIVAIPDHHVIKESIDSAIKNYQTAETDFLGEWRKNDGSFNHSLSRLDKKRSTLPKFAEVRFEETLDLAGPGNLCKAMNNYLRGLHPSLKTRENVRSVCTYDYDKGTHILAGTTADSICDNSWINKNPSPVKKDKNKKVGYELSSLPNSFMHRKKTDYIKDRELMLAHKNHKLIYKKLIHLQKTIREGLLILEEKTAELQMPLAGDPKYARVAEEKKYLTTASEKFQKILSQLEELKQYRTLDPHNLEAKQSEFKRLVNTTIKKPLEEIKKRGDNTLGRNFKEWIKVNVSETYLDSLIAPLSTETVLTKVLEQFEAADRKLKK